MMYAVSDLDAAGCDATVELLIVPDEEQEHGAPTGAEVLIKNGHVGDFLITGEPTDFHIGTQSKGVLDLRITLRGKSAHGSTPWLGKNAVLIANDHYRRVTQLPRSEEHTSELQSRQYLVCRLLLEIKTTLFCMATCRLVTFQ